MKRLAVVLSFSIALLSVSIEAQAQQQDTQAQQQEMLRQALIAQTLSNIAHMRYQMLRERADQLRADQGAQQRAAQTQVQAQQYPVAIEECYAVVQRDYANCKAAEYYSSFGHCENRRAERLASCSQGVFVPVGASRKDQCLKRVEAEYRNCGYRAVCTNRWIQGLQECN
jgi:hypothetical protein